MFGAITEFLQFLKLPVIKVSVFKEIFLLYSTPPHPQHNPTCLLFIVELHPRRNRNKFLKEKVHFTVTRSCQAGDLRASEPWVLKGNTRLPSKAAAPLREQVPLVCWEHPFSAPRAQV